MVPLFAILSLFPEALEPYTRESILGIAQAKGLVRILLVDYRDFTRDRHRTVDDRPFGGGPGMVIKPEPVVECVEWLERKYGGFRRIAMCPSGRIFRQSVAADLSLEERVLFLCGRYEGFDERILLELEMERLSIGDFVLSGGELASLVAVEAACRLVPGVLGDEQSSAQESFAAGAASAGAAGIRTMLDTPHYTRPRVFRGREVPEVLLGGDHAAIERWRREAALERTARERPDLLNERTQEFGDRKCT
jgi:tRNA (guanine37-N1)-methyltransferase